MPACLPRRHNSNNNNLKYNFFHPIFLRMPILYFLFLSRPLHSNIQILPMPKIGVTDDIFTFLKKKQKCKFSSTKAKGKQIRKYTKNMLDDHHNWNRIFLFYFFRRNILNKYEMKKINFKVDVTWEKWNGVNVYARLVSLYTYEWMSRITRLFRCFEWRDGREATRRSKISFESFLLFFWRLEICDTIIGSRATIASLNTFML